MRDKRRSWPVAANSYTSRQRRAPQGLEALPDGALGHEAPSLEMTLDLAFLPGRLCGCRTDLDILRLEVFLELALEAPVLVGLLARGAAVAARARPCTAALPAAWPNTLPAEDDAAFANAFPACCAIDGGGAGGGGGGGGCGG